MASKYTSNRKFAVSAQMAAASKALAQMAFDGVNFANLDAPRETGQLAQSGEVEPVTLLHFKVKFKRASKKGYNIAARMEFDKSLKHPRGGKAGYLSDAMKKVDEKHADYFKRYAVK